MIARAGGAEEQQFQLDIGSSAGDVERLRAVVRGGAQNFPGVYCMRGVHGEVLYVGKSNRVRTRLLSYFRLPWPEHRHARLLREASSIEWTYVPSEFAALLREVRLIRAHLPRYNVRSARPLDRWWVITIGDGPAPRLRVQRASAAARHRLASASVIGPFANRRPLISALRVLNDAMGLRDCAEHVPLFLRDARDLFCDSPEPALSRTPGCHRHETRRCAGPCVGGCTEGEYGVQLQRAKAVLEGSDNSPQQQLMHEMGMASAAMSYERAGWLRDRLAALQEMEDQLARVRESVSRPTCVYAVTGVPMAEAPGEDILYLIRDGRVCAEASRHDPSAIARLKRLAAEPLVSQAMNASADRLEELLMIEQWFRTRPDEHARTAATVDDAIATFVPATMAT